MSEVIIIEDNSACRKILRNYLDKYHINVLGESSLGLDLFSLLNDNKPEFIFLDIDLPDTNGMELAKKVHILYPEVGIIFTTSHAHYANEAFDIEAIDFLTKPYNEERLCTCLKKMSRWKSKENSTLQVPLYIKHKHGLELIEQNKIIFITSENKYTVLHYSTQEGKQKVLKTHESLKSIEERLDRSKFSRVHRSFIINIQQINRIEASGQTHLISFKNSNKVAFLSKQYLLSLYKKLNIV
ncbi:MULTISPECIES: LytR/AlgR family response regulator transcription factor [Priestia]|uniref:LytR/AlgR family response regulator transcription factor n=1 Tax=Priestia TaxID=2800373 RepID=UPI001375CB54|nr:MULTISPECIES: LytTR family DNA-binding domain-containing protein [Priestia]MCG0050189.1 LytTR family DNA-binding domain-containing protein [Priestia aryabhattai]